MCTAFEIQRQVAQYLFSVSFPMLMWTRCGVDGESSRSTPTSAVAISSFGELVRALLDEGASDSIISEEVVKML